MPDDETTTNQAPVAPAEIAPTAERTFTQAEVGRLLAEERKKVRDVLTPQVEAQASPEPAPTPAPPAKPKQQQDGTVRNRVRDLELRLAFSDAAVEHGIPRDVIGEIREMYGERDTDVGEFVVAKWKRLQALGVGKQAANDTETPVNGEANKGDLDATPVGEDPAPAAPNPTRDAERFTDPIQWSKDDISFLRQNGTFLQKVEQWASRLPGGGSGLFRKPKPGG